MWTLRSSSYLPSGITSGGSPRREAFGGRAGDAGIADGGPQREGEEQAGPLWRLPPRGVMAWAGATEPQPF